MSGVRWVANNIPQLQRLRRQQGGGRVMMWAGIIEDKLVGSFKVGGIKINSKHYVAFLKENFIPWFKKQKFSFKRNLIFMQDNAPSHVARNSLQYLPKVGFSGHRLMKWPAYSPDLNPIENLWSILKRMLYQDGRQLSTKDELWQTIVDAADSLAPDVVRSLTSTINKRARNVLFNSGSYIHH